MPEIDYSELPRFENRVSFLYLDRGKIERHENAVACFASDQILPIPVADLSLLLLGPGTTITHAAISVLAQANCIVHWVGEQGVRFYSHGKGGTHSSKNLLRQVRLWANQRTRRLVVRRMYEMRFGTKLEAGLTIEQIRGREGARVRAAYEHAANEFNVPWKKRQYDSLNWSKGDALNRAISTASATLNGLVQTAILAAGYSTGIGFIHTGKALSFVYDVADLFKIDLIVPIAFKAVAESERKIESRVRGECRDTFGRTGLLRRILPAIEEVFDVGDDSRESTQGTSGGVEPVDDRTEGRDIPRSHDCADPG